MHAPLLACCLILLGAPQPPAPPGSGHAAPHADRPASPGVQRLDAAAFFERLVARYRELASYRDLTSVVQITRDGPGSKSETQRTETQMICDVLDGELRIITPGSQLRDSLRETIGLSVRVRGARAGDREEHETGAAASEAPSLTANDGLAESPSQVGALARRYQLWLAPHLALKFAEEPLAEFRPTNHEPFTATEVSAVTVDDRVMVHVELKSGRASACAAAPDDFDAKFDLFVNPESMLIERIEGRERLPDGGSIETTYTIKPIVATAMEAMDEDAPACHGHAQPVLEDWPIDEPAAEEADEPGVVAPEPMTPGPVQTF